MNLGTDVMDRSADLDGCAEMDIVCKCLVYAHHR